MTDSQTRKLARQLVRMDERLKYLETVPQLAHSSIDDASLPVYDSEGNLVSQLGKQPDGTWGAPPLAGPVPPAPVGVSAVGGPGAVNVSWSGGYERGEAPLDFDTLEVLIDGTLAGAIPNRDGGTVSISAEQGTRYVAARIRTLVPRHSAMTSPFSVEVGPPADQLFLDAREAIEGAEEQIQDAKDAIEAETNAREQALQEAADTLADLEEKLDGIADSEELAGLRDQIAAAQDAVAQAQTDATAAKAAAAAAQTTADDAAESALAAAGIAADKGRIFYQPSAPTGDDESPNNLWIDSDNGKVYVWNGTEWEESQSEDLRDAAQAALVAQQAAEAADQKAQDAASSAAAADRKAQDAIAAAAAAQQTADQATLDAESAHNAAVSAAERVQAKIDAGDNLILNGSFEDGDLGWPKGGVHAGRSRIIESEEAHTGTHVLELTPDTNNAYPESDYRPIQGGRTIYVRGWIKLVSGSTGAGASILFRQRDRTDTIIASTYPMARIPPEGFTPGEWTLLEGDITLRDETATIRAGFHTSGPSDTVWHADDLLLIDVTEARAAQKAAEDAAELAASKPGMDEVNQAIIVSANGKNAITVSGDAPSSSTPGAVEGDTWFRADGSGQIFGQWTWTGEEWAPATIRSEVIANLDVGKLTVTGESRFTTAVVDRLFADIFAAHKITANELVIAALDEDGEIKPDSIEAVMIKDGQISANKILLLGDPNDPDEASLVATIASIMKLAVENLVVTEGATINEAVILKLATEMITAGVLRTADSGQRVVIDESGIVMFGVDPDGVEFELVRIGPHGDNLITAGDTTISPAGVQAPSGTFDELMVGGRALEAILEEMPRGRVAQNRYTVTSAYSNEGQIRISTSFDAEPFRKYRVTVTPFDAQAQGDTVITYKLGWAEGGNISTSWSGSNTLGWAQTQMFGTFEQQIPGIQADFTGNNLLNGKMSVALYTSTSNNYGVRLLGGSGHPLVLSVDDMGRAPEDTGAYWTAGNGGGGDPTPPPPSVQKYVKTYNATGYRCYDADGSSAGTPDVVQGLYAGGPSRLLRRGGWTFPSMTGDLSGATVDKVEAYIYCNHTYANSGSTVNLALWGGVMKDNLSVATSFSMKPGTGRWVTLPSNTYAGFKSGGWAGTGVRPTSSSSQQYARFHPSSAKIRITYRK